ncbi:hypothetical protein GAMM_160085 [Gammaproteobacteria bacterium]
MPNLFTNFFGGYLPQNWSRGAQIGVVAGGFVGGIVAAPVLGLGAGLTLLTVLGGMVLGGEVGIAIEKKYLLSVANKKLGISLPPITIKLKKEIIDGEERAVFNFEDVTAFNLDEINHAVDQYTKVTDVRAIENYKFEEKPKYSVRLVAKSDVTLGELDYSDMSSFDVVVTNQKTGKEASSAERDAVLTTLGVMPKFLGGELTDPEAKATEVIDEAGSAVGDWLKRNILGKTNRLTVDPNALPNPELEKEEFFDSLINVAISTGRYEEILGHYRNTMIAQYRKVNELKKSEKKLENHIDSCFGFLSRPSVRQFAVGLLVTAAFVATAFIPGLNVTVFALCALISFGFSIFKGVQLFNKFLEDRKFESERKANEAKIAKFESTFKGLDVTNRAIETCIKDKTSLLSLEKQEASDTCAQVISKWVCSPAGSACKELKLPGNNITLIGASKLAEALKNFSHIQKIDLSGNPIGEEGVEAIKDALLVNLTVTSFSYDKDETPPQLSKDIEKQLLINQYLQGISPDIGDHFTSQDEFHKAAIEKIKNTQVLPYLQAIDVTNSPSEIQRAIIQTQLHMILASTFPEAQRLDSYIAIYNKITHEDFEAIKEDQKIILQSVKIALFSKDRLRPISAPGVKALREMQDADRVALLEHSLVVIPSINEDDTNIHAHGIAVLTSRLIGFESTFAEPKLRECLEQWSTGKLSFDGYISHLKTVKASLPLPLKDEVETIIQAGLQADLPTRFTCLKGSSIDDFPKLQEALETSYELRSFEFPKEVDANVKKHVEGIIKRNQIRDILEHPLTPAALTKFFELYKDMDPKHLAAPAIDVGKLVTLVQTDAYNKIDKTMCVLLQSLDKTHRCTLLEKCFANRGETNAVRKAALVSNMITTVIAENSSFNFDNATHGDNGTLEHYIYYSTVAKDYSSKELKTRLDNRRKKLKKEEKDNEADRFDWILQADLRAELGTEFPFLCSPFEKPSPEQLAGLKTVLDKVPPDLRSEFPDKVDKGVKSYIAHIINRNKLNDAISDYATSEKKLKKFLAVYETIPDAERQECLKDFKKLAQGNEVALKALVQHDVDKPYDFKNLKALNETQRTEILEACLEKNPNAHGIATLAAQLLTAILQNESIDPKYVWQIFDWPSTIKSYTKWSFQEYIDQLKTLSNTLEDADRIDEIIQTGIQEDLIARFDCLRDNPENDESFRDLKDELEQQYDLTEFAPRPSSPGLGVVRTYIESICHRNLALQAAAEPCDLDDLNTFIREYKAIGTDLQPEKVSLLLEEVFSPLDEKQKLSILKTVALNLGSYEKTGGGSRWASDDRDNFTTVLDCKKLMELDRSHRMALLTQCFDTDQNAKEKAVLVSTMLDVLLKDEEKYQANKDQLLFKNLAYEIYWAISPEKEGSAQPYHNFVQLQTRLKEIEAKIDKGGYSDTPAELREAIKKNLTSALQPKPEAKLSLDLQKKSAESELEKSSVFEVINMDDG